MHVFTILGVSGLLRANPRKYMEDMQSFAGAEIQNLQTVMQMFSRLVHRAAE